MRSQTGQVLRMVGILIEVSGVILLFASRGKGWSVGSIPVENLSYVGIAVGLAVWIVAMVMVRATVRRPGP